MKKNSPYSGIYSVSPFHYHNYCIYTAVQSKKQVSPKSQVLTFFNKKFPIYIRNQPAFTDFVYRFYFLQYNDFFKKQNKVSPPHRTKLQSKNQVSP